MQGFNMGRYVPPDQEGLIMGNKLAGKHPLGSRARNLHKTGELTVRFEMPFAVWCSTCQPADSVLIGQGVRFNALKKKVGNYYSTPIYSFRMKHSVCGGWIEVRTDPQNTAYVVTEGGRRRDTGLEGDYDEDGVGEIRLRIAGKEPGQGEEKDAFAQLEGKVVDKRKLMTEKSRMEELEKQQGRDWQDPYERSQKLRRTFRVERKRQEAIQGTTKALKDKMSLSIELLDETEDDRIRAGMVDFAPSSTAPFSSRLGAKPLFKSQSLPTIPSKERGKRGKEKRKPATIAAERKSMLRQELSGNTRAALDPFLTDEKTWQPGTKRRRPDIQFGQATPVPKNDFNHDQQHINDESEIGTETREDTKNDFIASGAFALVDYESSDDSDESPVT